MRAIFLTVFLAVGMLASPAESQESMWWIAGVEEVAPHDVYQFDISTDSSAFDRTSLIRNAYFGSLIGAAYGGIIYFANNEGEDFSVFHVLRPALICGGLGALIGEIIS